MKGIALVMLISLAIFSAVTGWGLMAFLSADCSLQVHHGV